MIRKVTASDKLAIRRVNDLAFGQADEANLVDRLRSDGDALVELIAEADGKVVAHILFSRLFLCGSDVVEAAALAPMAVVPDHQRTGIGSTLVATGIAACRELSVPAIVVLGHPDYYPRFGFSAAAASRIKAPFDGPAFMALELAPGTLRSERVARYAPAFGLDDWFRETTEKSE
ncbi:N-acetyltransferase [Sphingobium limneticum]|uniref:GNAT family N-acetyltransferase n=1 Tax=Sphingobium TaxID=165695 RepID=UPI00123D6273|nr:N-acetyltransferase [Sphingobium limneticum]KAA9009670.1 N-acetyltransferase [Sphingobium limneticum]